MTAARKEDFLLTPDEAMRRSIETAATHLARARLQIAAAYPAIEPSTGKPPRNPPQHPELTGSVMNAQVLDYLAWVISARLTMTNDALKNIDCTLDRIARALESR